MHWVHTSHDKTELFAKRLLGTVIYGLVSFAFFYSTDEVKGSGGNGAKQAMKKGVPISFPAAVMRFEEHGIGLIFTSCMTCAKNGTDLCGWRTTC